MLFAEEFQTLIEVKKSLIQKAVENGVAKSSTLQVQTSRADAKVEEAILQVQHLAQTFAHFAKAAEDAAAAAGDAAAAAAPADPAAPAQSIDFKAAAEAKTNG